MKFIPLELLYWGHDEGTESTRVDMHWHDYCQIEFCRRGQRVCLGANKQEILFGEAEAVLIPMGCRHAFRAYEGKACSYFSFKFRVSGEVKLPLSLQKIPADSFTRYILGGMEDLLARTDNELNCSRPLVLEVLSVLLSGLLGHVRNGGGREEEHELLLFMRRAVYQFGSAISIKMIADGLKLTVPQLRYRFRKCMKSLPPEEPRFANPADFVAAEVMTVAQNHLKNTGLPIKRIAKLLKFNNVYAFSRYFKRNCGVSPRAYRSQFSTTHRESSAQE